jgi:small basic protein
LNVVEWARIHVRTAQLDGSRKDEAKALNGGLKCAMNRVCDRFAFQRGQICNALVSAALRACGDWSGTDVVCALE